MLNETINILNDLSLYGLKNNISNEIDYITNNKLSFLEGLNHFLKSEVKYREINRAEANIKVAHFPYLKEINDFDFDYQPSINKEVITNLSTFNFEIFMTFYFNIYILHLVVTIFLRESNKSITREILRVSTKQGKLLFVLFW